jgi:hypothetical protein
MTFCKIPAVNLRAPQAKIIENTRSWSWAKYTGKFKLDSKSCTTTTKQQLKTTMADWMSTVARHYNCHYNCHYNHLLWVRATKTLVLTRL